MPTSHALASSASVAVTSTTVLFRTRGFASFDSAGVSSDTSVINTVHNLPTSGSAGVTSVGTLNRKFALSSVGSVNVTGNSKPLHTINLVSSASSGVSGSSVVRKYIRYLVSQGSVNVSFSGTLNIRHNLPNPFSVGVSDKSSLSVRPASVPANTIFLFEATDLGSPASFSTVQPREYSRIFRDTTLSSYPTKFTLLN